MAKNKKQPETSLEAYASLRYADIREMHQRIISALKILGTATTEQIAAYLTVDHDKVWKRMSELEQIKVDGQQVYKPGHKLPNKSGRKAFVYSLQGTGATVQHKREKPPKGESVADLSRKIHKISEEVKKNKPMYIEQPLIPEHMFEKK